MTDSVCDSFGPAVMPVRLTEASPVSSLTMTSAMALSVGLSFTGVMLTATTRENVWLSAGVDRLLSVPPSSTVTVTLTGVPSAVKASGTGVTTTDPVELGLV